MWLFKFPSVRLTSYASASRAAVKSFVVVLPTLPVTATTRVPEARRTKRHHQLQGAGGIRNDDHYRALAVGSIGDRCSNPPRGH